MTETTVVLLTSGSYSDYGVHGLYHVPTAPYESKLEKLGVLELANQEADAAFRKGQAQGLPRTDPGLLQLTEAANLAALALRRCESAIFDWVREQEELSFTEFRA